MKSTWPTPPTLLATTLVAMLALHVLVPVAGIIPRPWTLAGLVPIAFGVAWNLRADKLLREHQTTVKPHLPPTALIETGPYRYSRNPMYVGMSAVAVGTAAALGTLAPLAVAAVFVGVLAVVFVPMEERSMAETFGEAWHAYTRRVRRWL